MIARVTLTPYAAGCVILTFAAASFFFSLAESAIFSLGQWQARRLAVRFPKRGAWLSILLKQPQEVLATLALGNTFANATIVATALWMILHHNWPTVGTVIAILCLILIGCEVIPKTLAVRRPDRWALRLAPPLWWIQKVSQPVRRVAHWLNVVLLKTAAVKSGVAATALTDEDYQELLELAFQQGTLALSEKETILEIISLDRRTVREVMRPRSQMACLSDDLSVEEMIAAARQFRHRRLPIYDETPDTIVGVLNTRTLLLNPQIDLEEAIEFPSFVPASMNLLKLLQSMQRQQRGLAVVLDEFGGTAGVVTVEDILEEVIGEIRSENEESGFIMEKLGEGCWRVSGTMRLDDFRREYPGLGQVPEVETMGGLMLAKMEVVPSAGQSVTCFGLRLTALGVDERRVRELRVETIRKRSSA